MPVAKLLGEFGASDCLGLQSVVPGDPYEGVSVAAGHRSAIELSPACAAVWHRIAAHLAAAVRLRRAQPGTHPVESVLTPDGRVEHAEGDARGRSP